MGIENQVVGLSNAFRLAVSAMIHMEDFQMMMLAFGLTVVGFFSLIALWLWVKGGIQKNEYR